MKMVVCSTGGDAIRDWSSILDSNTKVIVSTLNIDTPYLPAPWLCLQATLRQRQFEIKAAFAKFGVTDIIFLDYPSMEDFEVDRTLAYLQMITLLFRIRNLYCNGSNVSLYSVCKEIQGVNNLITTPDQSSFSNRQKEEAQLELKEILLS